MRDITLTDGEAYDAAHIVRAYATRIRRDVHDLSETTPLAIRVALEQAAEQRDRLADKLDGGEGA